MCPVVKHKYSDATLQSSDPNGPNFREISGLAFSYTQKYNGQPIFFAASDGGGDARIGIFDSETGKRLKTIRVDRSFFRNTDWEALTVGSCGSTGVEESCLYIMDAGDNRARTTNGNNGRNNYQILKIREPQMNEYDDNDMISSSDVSRLEFDYRDSSSPSNHADCETMFLDHVGWGDDELIGGEIFIVQSFFFAFLHPDIPVCFYTIQLKDIYLATKWDGGNIRTKNRLFRVPADAWSSSMNATTTTFSPKTVGTYNYGKYQNNGGSHFMKYTWTNGEMSFDGTLIGLGTTRNSYVFLRCPGTSVVDALVNPDAGSRACLDWSHPASGQVESFAWTPDKNYTLDIPEGNTPKLGWTKMKYDRNETSRACPRGATEAPSNFLSENPTMDVSESPTISPSTTSEQTMDTSCVGHDFKLLLHTDLSGSEVSWELKDTDQHWVAAGTGYPSSAAVEISRCLGAGKYTFTIWDSSGDGICCEKGQGWYQLWFDGEVVHDSAGNFGSAEVVSFGETAILGSPAPPTDAPTSSATVSAMDEFSGDTQVPKTGAPTRSPISSATSVPTMGQYSGDSEDDIFCQGICPSGSYLLHDSEIAQLTDGNNILCGELQLQYREVFDKPSVCDEMAALALDAGCRCSYSTADDSTSKSISENHKDKDLGFIDYDTAAWIFAVLCIAFLGFLLRHSRPKANIQNASGHDPTILACNGESIASNSCRDENSDLAGIKPKGGGSQLQESTFSQSWAVWTETSDNDFETVAESLDSETLYTI